MALSSDQIALLQMKKRGCFTHLVRVAHPDAPIRHSTLPFDWRDAGGTLWTGHGLMIDLSPAASQTGMVSTTMDITWAGADLALRGLALDRKIRGAAVYRYLAFIDERGAQIDDLVSVWAGVCGEPSISGDPDAPEITISADQKLVTLNRANPSLATPEDHARYFPADTGFDYVAGLIDKTITFGG
ncbi:hypothetical protein [Pikeienuella sp. HZG-20]|uniref:hypothetical protein n=1 Tax=Paludibacillus litoralis TaxID=3133267 RepID=UPI0030EB8A1E